jgi:hypothetical protein
LPRKPGWAHKYYQHVESGRRRDIRLSTMVKLAKACGMEPWELLNFDSAPSVVAEEPPTDAKPKPVRRRKKA